MKLTIEQIKKLAEISKRHTSPAYLYKFGREGAIEVEFEFPYRYCIAVDGSEYREIVA